MRLGVVSGLVAEAACLPDGMAIRCAGPGPRAAQAAAALLAGGAAALVSFGVAGGLSRKLQPGDLVLAETVVLPDGSVLPADPRLRARLAHLSCHGGAVVGSDVPVLTPAAKRALRHATGGMAVDMESHVVARAAAAAGVPFLAVRAILDAADEAVPQLALAGMGEDGRSHALPVMAGLLRQPWQLPALLRLSRRMNAALAGLRRAGAELTAVGRSE